MAGAVSGNGVQNATFAPDPAFLAGTVDDGFESGDRGYVASLYPKGRFYLDRDSVLAPDNVNVIATLSGNGRWLAESTGTGGPLVTENLPVTVPGQTVFVLAAVPTGAVIMFVNGVQYRQGVGFAYTVAANMVTWLFPGTAPFTLVPADEVTFAYN